MGDDNDNNNADDDDDNDDYTYIIETKTIWIWIKKQRQNDNNVIPYEHEMKFYISYCSRGWVDLSFFVVGWVGSMERGWINIVELEVKTLYFIICECA